VDKKLAVSDLLGVDSIVAVRAVCQALQVKELVKVGFTRGKISADICAKNCAFETLLSNKK
jgi:hypothetical protein